MRRVTALALSFCFLGCTPLAAQRIDSLAVGAIVRVKLALPLLDMVRGKLLARDSTGLLTLESTADGTPVTIGRREILSLEVQGPTRTAGQAFGHGAKWGALTGLGISVVLVAVGAIADVRHPCEDICIISNTAAAGIVSVPIMILTPLIGGLIGLSSRERWTRVPLTP